MISFVIFALIGVFAVNYFKSIGVTLGPPSQRVNVSMEVPDVNGLVVGSSVQLRGVPIGEVNSIATTAAGATVRFWFDSRFRIPIDSDVRLENLSALGEAYIGLLPRTDSTPVLQDGQRIATELITQPPSISELATSVVRALNQVDPEALERIIHETDTALPDTTEVLPNLSRTNTLLRNTAAHMNGKGRDLLGNFQVLLRNAGFVGPVLAFNAPYIPRIGYDFNWAFANAVEIYRRGGPGTVHNFEHFIGRVEHLLDHSAGDLKVLMQSMLPYLNDISGALMNLDTGQVLGNMLAAVPEDGAVTLHVTVPEAGVPADPAGVPQGPPLGGPPTFAAPAPEDTPVTTRPTATVLPGG